MLIVKNKRYLKKHIVEGSGLFDTIAGFFKRLVSTNAARSIASNLSKAAASDIGKSAIDAAKTVGKELATSAISTAKDLAIDKGKRLIAKTSSKVLTPRNAEVIKQITGVEPAISGAREPSALTQKSKDLLTNLVDGITSNSGATTNINKLMMGQGVNKHASGQAIRIQDLVRKMNGSGLRLA